MKKFIYKTSIFIIPFGILYVITVLLCSTSENPDLLRIGYLPNIYFNYRNGFELGNPERFEKLSTTENKNFEILIIGDSFSEQGGYGYKNFLSENFKVLHIDRCVSRNQVQTLIELINGGFFNEYNVKYVVLQIVESNFIALTENIKFDSKISFAEIDSIIKNQPVANQPELDFFSRTTISFPLYYLPQFFLNKNYLSNKVYNYTLKSNSLFSNSSDRLLFYQYDLSSTVKNNSLKNISAANNVINEISNMLNSLDVKLILLPAPVKYDFYYNYIADTSKLVEPLFFKHMKSMTKRYIYIDSKDILLSHVNEVKDLYFYDDTHWSPNASKIISSELSKTIMSDKK